MNPNEDDAIQLDIVQFALGRVISEEVLREMAGFASGGRVRFETYRDMVTGSFRASLRMAFACQKSAPVVVRYPQTAWDHVKRDWLPTFTRWFGWSVREVIDEVTARIVYPDVALPSERTIYRIDRITTVKGESHGNEETEDADEADAPDAEERL